MKPVLQEETTGCAIASIAAIAGISYEEARKIVGGMGITAKDPALWSETTYVRRMLANLDIQSGRREIPFADRESLPECALLSIKWHLEDGKPYWHWVVFVREGERHYVLDSKKSLKMNIRTDLGRMKPKWYIEVKV